ncbi:MAG: RdgB/HAM1 family non-canonical purine NTP pyrophosphatase [Lachnospiraceae bacterium]|nr:RdgB/HAM1 family non-canonical purine NTP pyrophosphatase [Lachnospiraceae bacterium]
MGKREIIFATANEDKMNEIRMILKDLGIEVISMKDAGITADIVEDGETFEDNAIIKARTIMQETGKITLADDSGLEVDYLNKEPGVYSARYCGRDTSYRIKNRNILERLTDVPDELRSARFVCAVALAIPAGLLQGVDEDTIRTVRGTMEGRIGYEEKGEHGFGYDPIFYLPELSCYSGELLPEKKNEISHRGKALRMMKKVLEDYGI